jgi:hypothetical protein
MLNYPISILDGVCYSFSVNSENKMVLLQSYGGLKELSSKDSNKIIPYLAKDTEKVNGVWEIGLGQLEYADNVFSVSRVRVLSSSNNNESVSFDGVVSSKLYVLANEFNFNTGFQNVLIKNENFTVENVQSIYLLNNNDQDITIDLIDSSDNINLLLEFKLLHTNSSHKAYIKKNNSIWLELDSNKTNCRLVSGGFDWVELSEQIVSEAPTLQQEVNLPQTYLQAIAGSGLPGGDPYSLQFNSSGSFDGLPVYYVDNNLLCGGSGINQANTIIPLSTSGSMVFNNRNYQSDFIVKGSGDKNLYFGYDGKLGINMPVNARPLTALHIVNNSCIEGIRLENRNQCHPANLTLYHKPSTVPATGTIAASINFSGKNSVSQQVNYVQLRSRILNPIAGSTSGEFVVSVDNSGSLVDMLSITNNRFRVAVGSNAFDLSPSGLDITGKVSLRNFDIDGGVIVFGGLSSDNSPSTSPTPTPTITVTSSLTPTPTVTTTATPTPTPTPTPTIA